MKIKRFQEGGAAPAPEQAAQGGAPAGGPGPEEQIAQMAQQIVQQLGPEAAAMLAQTIMQMLQGAGGGGGEQPQAQAQPQYQRKGGKLVPVSKQ
jgi:hypothetical protein